MGDFTCGDPMKIAFLPKQVHEQMIIFFPLMKQNGIYFEMEVITGDMMRLTRRSTE